MDPTTPEGVHDAAAGSKTQWQQIWRLVRDAERRPVDERQTWLFTSNPDPFVVRKVLEILEASTKAATQASLPDGPAQGPVDSKTGLQVGRYRIGSLIGAGGAGAVYAGFDEALDRAVAMKFLSRQRLGDRERVFREARAASALNHPHIVTIHEVVEDEDEAAIVMELVDGQTMRQRLVERPALTGALDWCRQLAHALTAAHANGIVHGDMKPENVMIRADGYVKLLDFGLAQGGRLSQRTADPFAGTLRYLSPEQWQGGIASANADIFALGVMTYEATTGRFPFEAADPLAIMQAVVSGEPGRARELPAALESLILRMLAKDAAARPTAEQVARSLANLAHAPEPKRARWPLAAAAAVLLMGAVAYWMSRPAASPVDFSRRNIRPMASQPGFETAPSLSPDGKLLANLYSPSEGGKMRLQIHPTPGGPPVEIDPGEVDLYAQAGWSPNGAELAILGQEPSGVYYIYRMQARGGKLTKVVELNRRVEGEAGFDWSPDGRRMVFGDAPAPGGRDISLYLWELDSGKRVALAGTETAAARNDLRMGPSGPRFSPDGKWIVFERPQSFTRSDLYLVPAAGGTVQPLTHDAAHLSGFAWWPDSRSVMAISSRTGIRAIWNFPVGGGAPVLALSNPGRISDVTLARRSSEAAWSGDLRDVNLWRFPVRAKNGQPSRLTDSSNVEIEGEWSKSGLLAYISNRSGAQQVWVARADGSQARQVTNFRNDLTGRPSWSPDGRHLAFVAQSESNADIFTLACDPVPLQCGEQRQLTHHKETDADAKWSADGQFLYFSSNRSGRFEVWRIPGAGGEAVQVTRNGGFHPLQSADGKWLYYSKLGDLNAIFRAPTGQRGFEQEREETLVKDVEFWIATSWTVSSTELLYPAKPNPPGPGYVIRALDLATRGSRDISTGGKLLRSGMAVSADEQWVLVSSADRNTRNIMIAE